MVESAELSASVLVAIGAFLSTNGGPEANLRAALRRRDSSGHGPTTEGWRRAAGRVGAA